MHIDIAPSWSKVISLSNYIADFSLHCCRVANINKVNQLDISIDDLIQKGHWKNSKYYFTYYNKEMIQYTSDDGNVIIIYQEKR